MVQPPPAAPPGTKNDSNISKTPGTKVQYDSMFSTGNAMSLAPMQMGMRKLPKPPTMIGMTTKKIMMVACMVNSVL